MGSSIFNPFGGRLAAYLLRRASVNVHALKSAFPPYFTSKRRKASSRYVGVASPRRNIITPCSLTSSGEGKHLYSGGVDFFTPPLCYQRMADDH
ncbi:Hypothetical protein NTJ_00817 [Nesidiocoris tenuis]|uniref:Uncharacterized protein n=1 Tax=Nesidiocoris tenuis TaxID=355587 RepID=A0ABN7A795_9HEMI|nr:Hypothetical protein NTJ_00817 [Nesidiocoris tenuis]